MALTYVNRLVPEPIGVDANRDSVITAFPGSGTGAVSVFALVDAGGNRVYLLVNISGTTIDPNADTTYDAADINSIFIDGVGGKFYVKSSAAAWTEIT